MCKSGKYTLGFQYFVRLDGGFPVCQVQTIAQNSSIIDGLEVEHYKQGRTVSINFWFPSLLVYCVVRSMILALVWCRFSDTGFRQFKSSVKHHLHLPQVLFSLESGLTQAPSHCQESYLMQVLAFTRYLECMRQASRLQLWINDHNNH